MLFNSSLEEKLQIVTQSLRIFALIWQTPLVLSGIISVVISYVCLNLASSLSTICRVPDIRILRICILQKIHGKGLKTL